MRPMRTTGVLLSAAVGVLVGIGISACAGTARSAPPGVVMGQALPPAVRGQQVYTTDCAGCHRARPPTTYSRERWDAVLPRMEARARLSREDAAAVEAYVAEALIAPDASPK